MPDYRRYFVPGGTFFFTLVTHQRQPLFNHPEARKLLGKILRICKRQWPFEIDAIVLLPDHLHTIWSLPPGDSSYPRRWGWIKKQFTKTWLDMGGTELPISSGRKEERRRGIWLPRYWEHTIEDESDFDAHFDYIHYNPVKHGYVTCPSDWPWSSFHRWVREGVYAVNWACENQQETKLDFSRLKHSVGE